MYSNNLRSELNSLSKFCRTPRQLIGFIVFAAAVLWATPSSAQSTQPVFALAKNICTGNFAQILASGTGQNPANCPLATNVTAMTDAYYVITVTNPWGQPQQQINLIDALPTGFVQNGVIVCRDDAAPTPNVIPLNPGSGANTIGSISLAPGVTVHCFIQGSFQNPAPNTSTTRVNTVNASNGGATPFNMTASVTTNIVKTTPLFADLSVNKTSSSAVDVSGGPALITYTIVIKNNSTPTVANVGDYFKLNDNLSLPANGVPLNVGVVSASCVSTAGTDCLAAGGPNQLAPSPVFVGPSAPTNFFDWGFDAGQGTIQPLGVITLTVVIEVSQVPGMGCTRSLSGNGLINQAFFTLANATGAYSELNPANNTSSVTTGVSTGQTTVDPNCGKGHLRIKKTQISPAPGRPVAWGTQVMYEITIENFSIPAQEITVMPADFQDWITEGMNTPPFQRRHVQTTCSSSTDPNLCASFNPGIAPDADYSYKFYGEKNRAWISNNKFSLKSGNSVTFQTEFIYTRAACDTVPNAQPKPIINTAKLRYSASAYGAASDNPQDVVFDMEASAITSMEELPVCQFQVTKKFTKPMTRIEFGVPFSYDITYSNLGTARTVGTLLDAVRLTIPNYASKLPYTANWTCSASGAITGASLVGSISGNANYTSNPMQGAPAANLGSNIFFPANSSLVCKIDITIQRPAPNDPFCTQDKAEFENLALMDVTHPFNSNINWPPASTYNPASNSNPTPQNVNWAAVKAQLPACWDATVNKSATVDGLPTTNAPWTYVGGPGINYAITTFNKGQSNLGNPTAPPAAPQWTVTDNFSAPYLNSNATAGSPICGPTSAAWCHSAPPMDPKSVIAIKSLAPNASGVWNIKYTGPFTTATNAITNCAATKPELGTEAANYYQNSIPSTTPTACITIPVVEVTEIKVKKILDDKTGANVKVGGAFDFQISAAPFPIPSAQANFSLTTDISGTSPVRTVFPVARGSTVTLSEITAPIPALSANQCGGAGNVEVIKEYQVGSGTWMPMPAVVGNLNAQSVGNIINVRNTLRCKPSAIQITKIVTGPAQLANINQNYTITATCNPAATPTSVILNAGAQSASGAIAAIANASCTILEAPPQIPQGIKDHCTGLGQTAAWDPITYSPANPVTVGAGTTTVTVTNKWKCMPSAATMFHVMKILDPGPGGVQLSGLSFTVQASCNPSASTPTFATGGSGISPNGNLISILFVPSGSSCTFSEPSMPIFPQPALTQCAPGTPVWNTPTFATSLLVLKVTNSWACSPSSNTGVTTQLVITKKVEGPTVPGTFAQPPATSQNYQVSANCALPGTPATTSVLNLNAGSTSPASGTITVSAGAICNLAEQAPSTPSQITSYCQSHYGTNQAPLTVFWEPPVFTPSANPTMNAGTNSATVTNKWKCMPTTPTVATLTINKVVNKPHPGNGIPNADAQNYQINATCYGSPVTVNASGASSGSSTVNITPGATCSFSESSPTIPSNIAAFCVGIGNPVWKPPVFTPASLTLANGSNTVTVTNTWECAPTNVTLQLKKVVNGPSQITIPVPSAPLQSFQINGTCLGSPVAVTAGGSSIGGATKNNLILNANCSFSEAAPTVDAALNNYCALVNGTSVGTATWAAPVFNPPSLILASGVNTVTVTNTWGCVAPIASSTGTVRFYKKVSGPTTPAGAPSLGSLNYSFSAIGATPASVSIAATNVSANYSPSLTAPVNTSLNVTESLPSISANALAQNFCGSGKTPMWNLPTFTKVISTNPTVEQPVTMPITVTAGVTSIVVTNTWRCQ